MPKWPEARVLQTLEVRRGIPALKAVPGDFLIVWSDRSVDVGHRIPLGAATVARALGTGAATPLADDEGDQSTARYPVPHHLQLVKG
jgi:hypothetical protein